MVVVGSVLCEAARTPPRSRRLLRSVLRMRVRLLREVIGIMVSGGAMKTITLAAACVVFTLAIPGWVRTQPGAPTTQPLDQAAMRAVVERAGELLTANYVF